MKFLPEKAVIEMHNRLIAKYGGAEGIRDSRLLDSAINNPKTRFHFLQSSVFELAADYAFHIS